MPAGAVILAVAVAVLLGVTEAVQLEIVKTVGIALAGGCSAYAARQARCARLELARRRREVRDPHHEHVTVLEHPPDGGPGAHRRATDREGD